MNGKSVSKTPPRCALNLKTTFTHLNLSHVGNTHTEDSKPTTIQPRYTEHQVKYLQ